MSSYDQYNESTSLLTGSMGYNAGEHPYGSSVNVGDDDMPIIDLTNASGRPPRTGSIATSIFNMCNAVLGAGVLAFPSAYSDTGCIAGVVTSVILVILCGAGLGVLGFVHKRSDAYTIQEMASKLLGRKYGVVLEVLLLIYFLAASVVYLTVIGDSATPPFQHWGGMHWYTNRRFIIAVFTIAFALPLAWVKRINLLSFSSAIAVAAVMYTVAFVCVDGATHAHATDVKLYFNASTDFFLSFPIVCFAFQCHVATVPILGELKNPSGKRIGTVIVATLGICLLLYILCGVFGYFRFGSVVAGDVLKMYDASNVPAGIARVAMGFTATFSYPIAAYNGRLTMQSLFFGTRAFSNLQHFSIMTAWVLISLGLALVVSQITTVFDFVGSTGAPAFMFVYPILFIGHYYADKKKWVKPAIVITIILSVFIGGAAVGVTIKGLVNGQQK